MEETVSLPLVTKEDLIAMYSTSKVNQQQNALKYYQALQLKKEKGYGSLRASRIIDMPHSAVHYWFLGYKPKSVKGIQELELMGLLPFSLKLTLSLEHFVRTFGLRYADGCVYAQKRNNSYTGYLCFGRKEEAEKYVQDSLKIWNIHLKVHSSSHAYYVYLPASLVRLMIVLGSPVGNKTSQPFVIPNWVFILPTEFKAAFLDGVFSGDGTVPKLKISRKSCESIKLSMRAEEKIVYSFSSGFMYDIWELLKDVGVNATKPSIKFTLPYCSKKNIITYPVNLTVLTKRDNLIKFLNVVPYTYSSKGNQRVKEILSILQNEK